MAGLVDSARVSALNRTLERYPESVSGYVLRGELYLDAGYHTLAIQDFNAALQYAARQLHTENWGMVTQTLRDRAQKGLERALSEQRRRTTP